jgi:putative transposase
MRRKTRRAFSLPGHAHELTISCYHRLPLLSRDRTRCWFIEAVEAARERHHFDLVAYVIMPEQAHLLLNPRRQNYDMASILWSIKQPVAKEALAWLREHRPAWLKHLEGE